MEVKKHYEIESEKLIAKKKIEIRKKFSYLYFFFDFAPEMVTTI